MVVFSSFNRYLVIVHSKNIQDTTDVAVTTNEPSPNAIIDAIKAGISAITTAYIFFSTESPLWACGDVDINSLAISFNNYLVLRERIIPPTLFFVNLTQSSRGLCDGHDD